MNSKIFRLTIPLLLIFLCLVLASCFGKCNKMQWVLEAIDRGRSSVKIHLNVSDTVISRNDIMKYKECYNNSIDSHFLLPEDSCERFEFNFTIINKHNKEIQIPLTGLVFGTDYYADIKIELWSENWKLRYGLVQRTHPYPCTRPDYKLTTLKPNESINFPTSFNLYNIITLYLTKPYPIGVYNLYITYSNPCWKESDPFIWVGESRSNTVSFEIVD